LTDTWDSPNPSDLVPFKDISQKKKKKPGWLFLHCTFSAADPLSVLGIG
jgi:hypothetical protein